MTRLPMVPDGWLGLASLDADPGPVLLGGVPDSEEPLSISGALLDAASPPPNSTGLSVLMDPKDIATVPGLPAHYYGDGNAEAGAVDSASWTPPDKNSNSSPKPPPTDQPQPGEKDEKGAKGIDYLRKTMNWWDLQNQALGLHLGPEAPKMLGEYVKRADRVLAPVQHGLEAAGEIAKGAPTLPTVLGAGAKTAAELGAGELTGAALGSFAGPFGTVGGAMLGGYIADRALGKYSNQQVGAAIQHIPEEAGRSYSTYVLNNPYYDPRLAAVP